MGMFSPTEPGTIRFVSRCGVPEVMTKAYGFVIVVAPLVTRTS
jgi:hypothetical protein